MVKRGGDQCGIPREGYILSVGVPGHAVSSVVARRRNSKSTVRKSHAGSEPSEALLVETFTARALSACAAETRHSCGELIR